MSQARMTYGGQDPGLLTGRYGAGVILERRQMGLIPAATRRNVSVPSRPGSWDFGTELGERSIDLELAAIKPELEGALVALADLFDPTEGAQQLIFDTLPDRYFMARLVGEPVPVIYPGAARVTLSMRCADPFAYSIAEYSTQGGGATLTGFNAYRQIPERIGWNLVKNGGLLAGYGGWTMHANASIVTDAASVSGYALRYASAGAYQVSSQTIPVEGGKAYSAAFQARVESGFAVLSLQWLDADGLYITYWADVQTASATYVEITALNGIAPPKARYVYAQLTTPAAGAIAHFTAVRIKQQATAPAAWSAADQQTLGNKGLAVYEGATNLLPNGNLESGLTGAIRAFDDQFANLNAWATTGAPTVAANVVTMPSAATLTGGHPDWTDWTAGSRLRFRWNTGAAIYWYVRYVDANNWVAVVYDGWGPYVGKKINGVYSTIVGQQYQPGVDGTWFWFDATITGTAFSIRLFADSAGAPGAQLNNTMAVTVADASVAAGKMLIGLSGATGAVGGAYADVCIVNIPAPPGWSVVHSSGVPAFAVSSSKRFSGYYSLSIFNNNADAWGYWAGAALSAIAVHTVSARVSTSAVSAGDGAILNFGGQSNTGGLTGTADWTARTVTGTPNTTNTNVFAQLKHVTGQVWYDQIWFAQQDLDTGNADPSGLAYVIGTRAASNVALPMPAGFTYGTSFAVVATLRPDHANTVVSGLPRYAIMLSSSDAERIALYRSAATTWVLVKVRLSGISGEAVSAACPAFAAGDTVTVAIRYDSTIGIDFWIAVNGGTPFKVSDASAAAMLAMTVAPTTLTVGSYSNATAQANATFGVVRIERGGRTDAQITALMAAPYRAQDPVTEFDVWRFDGGTATENFANNTLDVIAGGTYKALPVFNLTAGAAFGPANLTITDKAGRVLTWAGSLAANDVLSIESVTQRVRKNGILAMSGVQAASKWPELLPAQENPIVVGGIPAASIKAVRATWRDRWL